MNSIVVTGDRPTGKLHLGHYVGSLVTRLELQQNHQIYILIADTQVLNNDLSKSTQVKQNILSLMRDYISCGLDPQKVTFVLQSKVLQIFELSNYLSNLAPLSLVMRNPTIKAENQLYNDNLNMGFLNYPISQTADILVLGGDLVPVGVDQTPILEFGNDIIEKFHHYFSSEVFKKIKPLLSKTPRLIGIDGKNKMSKSLNNAIFLSDSTQEVKKKINKMYTDSNHLKITDPGQVEGNVVFSFLDVFMKDTQKLNDLKSHYRKGGLGDGYLKGLLLEEIENILIPIRGKSSQLKDSDLMSILNEGTEKAKIKAEEKMEKIRKIIFK